MASRKPSKTQLAALQHFADEPTEPGAAAEESWLSQDNGDRLAWYRHERTLRSLMNHGWVDAKGITASGLSVLSKG